MIFYVPLMCCEYRAVSLLTSVHPIQCATKSHDSAFTGSKDALCIQPSALKLSMNSKMCEPCTIFRIVIYIDIANVSNYDRFNVIFLCHSGGIIYHHAKPLSM